MKADIVDTLTKARLTFPINQLEYFFESSDRIKTQKVKNNVLYYLELAWTKIVIHKK